MSSTALSREAEVKHAEKVVAAWCLRMDHLVLKDEHEEAKRLKRRMHLHMGLFIAVSVLTFTAVISLVSMSYVVGATLCLQYVQEYIDYVGGF